jgi:hypothetical protein
MEKSAIWETIGLWASDKKIQPPIMAHEGFIAMFTKACEWSSFRYR